MKVWCCSGLAVCTCLIDAWGFLHPCLSQVDFFFFFFLALVRVKLDLCIKYSAETRGTVMVLCLLRSAGAVAGDSSSCWRITE